MSRITGERVGRDIERRQWSNLDRHRSNLHLIGRGEGYVDELYFGKGFSNPPSFTYSATFNNEETVTLSYATIAPRGSLTREVDQYGMGNDSQSHGGMIQDPTFESQAKYHTLDAGTLTASQIIPTTDEAMSRAYNNSQTGYPNDSTFWLPLRIELDSNYTNDWAPKYYASPQNYEQYGPHRWLQTSDQIGRWTVDLTQSHDMGVGEAGQASAKVTIGASGVSPWLIPLDRDYPLDTEMNDYPNAWRVYRSVNEPANSTHVATFGGGIIAPAYPPAYIEGFEGVLYAKGDADYTVEAQAVFSTENYYPGGYPGGGGIGETVFPDSVYRDDTSNDTYGYRELGRSDFEQSVVGTGWSRVEVVLPYTGWRPWPDADTCLGFKELPDWAYWTLKFRVKGDPGTVVNMDNIFMTRQMRNVDVPILTVGVDEWIVDEAGVYIGAKLWIKFGTPVGQTCNIADDGGG